MTRITRRELLARFDLDPQRCVVVPNGLDPRFESPPGGQPHEDTPAGPYFLFVGTLEQRKNLHRLIAAFAGCDPEHRTGVEQGSHDELMQRRGVYWRLYQLQYQEQEQENDS